MSDGANAVAQTTSPIEAVVDFLLEREPWLQHCPREHALGFVGWYWRDARVGIVRDGPKILAVALARCVNEIATARAQPYHHDERGRIVWVDHIASVHPDGVKYLLRHAMQRFGPREAFAGEVFRRDGELRMLPWKVVERMTSDHGITEHSGAAGRT